MPFLYNEKVAVTKDELKPWYKPEVLSVTLTRYKKKNYGIKRLSSGRNGSQLLVDFDTLPKEIQDALGDPRKCDHILERFYKKDAAAVNFYATYRPEGSLLPLDIEKQERYVINASLLKAALALKDARETERKSKGSSIRGVPATVWEDVMSFRDTLRVKFKTEHTLPESQARFIEVMNKFDKEGFASIINKNEGNKNALKVTDQTLDLLKSMFAGQKKKPTATDVYRGYDSFINGYTEVVNLETGEAYDRAEFKPLSDATVKNYMASWAVAIGTHQLRSTNRQILMGKFKPYHSLDRPKYAGSIISIDDRQPPFKALNGKRVWFYNGIDLGSEAFTCWVWGETKEELILKFYRQLVRNYIMWGFNIPHELECEMSLNHSLTGTILQEGVMFQKIRIEANNARGKRIERYFGSLRYGIEKERDGWLARPHALKESNQAAVDSTKVPMLPYEDIIENALSDIETWNNQPHSVHTHMSRWEVFCQMQNPDVKPANYASILWYIGRKTTTSCNVGIIRLNHGECLLGVDGKIALGDNLITLMKHIEGESLDVYWIDDNDGRLLKAAVYQGTQYICDAIAKPTYNRATIEQTEADHLARKIMSSYVATIESYGKRQKNKIDQVLLIDRTPKKEKSFVIPSLKQNKQPASQSGGIMPELEQDTVQTSKANFTPSLLDRF